MMATEAERCSLLADAGTLSAAAGVLMRHAKPKGIIGRCIRDIHVTVLRRAAEGLRKKAQQ